MSQIGFSQARTGRRARSGGNFGSIGQMEFEPGKRNRIFFPLRKDEEGNQSLILFGETIHRFNDHTVIQIPKRKSGYYNPYTFRCTHPYSQQTHDKAVELAERKEMCVLCEYQRLHNSKRLEIMKQEFGTEENDYEDGFDNFKELDKKEKKAFFKQYEIPVEPSFFEKENEDGETFRSNTAEMYLLAIQIETEEKVKKVKSKKTGKVREVSVTEPLLDDEGNVKFKPVFYRVSGKKLNTFKNAVDNAIESDVLSLDDLTPYIENEGTDYEEEVLIGWVDFDLNYPKGDKMESGRDVNITATKSDKSIFTTHPEIREQIEGKIEGYYKDAVETFSKLFKHLKAYTRDEFMTMLSPEAKAEFLQLREEYRTEEDDKFEQEIYENVLNGGSDDEDSDTKQEEKTKSESKKESKPKKVTKSKKEEKPTEDSSGEVNDDKLDSDDDIDEDELFDDI